MVLTQCEKNEVEAMLAGARKLLSESQVSLVRSRRLLQGAEATTQPPLRQDNGVRP